MPDLVIRFQKPEDWSEPVRLHYWDAEPGGGGSQWPGVTMTAEGSGWYSHTLPGARSVRLVFNDGAGRQTGDLHRRGSGWFDGERWHDSRPEPGAAPPARPAQGRVKASKPQPRKPQPKLTGKDFREETIYFLLTTRFYDGDPSNNFFCRDRIRFDPATGEAIDPHWRGDFKGLIQRLDYIRDLGFTAIWITPPIENRSGLDYHGYHGYDWTRID
ncbi:MAG: starch-binding protein, partial [Rhodospirillales bacterium]